MNETLNRIAVRERYKHALPIFRALAANNIPFAVHKGAPLSKVIYSDPFVRVSGDIDILLPRERINDALSLLNKNSFAQGKILNSKFVPATRRETVFHMAHTHQTMPLYKKNENPLCPYVCIDVNTDIFWGESGVHTDMIEFLSDTVDFTLFDSCTVPVLPPEKMFLAMCLHHYKDMNSLYLLYSRNGFPLSHLDEINRFLSGGTLNHDVLLDVTKKLHVGRYVYTCLFAAEKFAGIPTPHPLLTSLHHLDCDDNYNTFGLTDSERRRWNGDPLEIVRNGNVREYLDNILSDADKAKIRINELYIG